MDVSVRDVGADAPIMRLPVIFRSEGRAFGRFS